MGHRRFDVSISECDRSASYQKPQTTFVQYEKQIVHELPSSVFPDKCRRILATNYATNSLNVGRRIS